MAKSEAAPTPPNAPTMKVVRTGDLPWAAGMQRGRFHNERKDLGGLEIVRSGLWRLPPGKKSFPLHRHFATEEALFVVSGSGKVRTEAGETPIGPGDYVAFPAGADAHQLVNDGSEPLVYLALSANRGTVDFVEYPESKKIGAVAGYGPGGRRFLLPADKQLDYFEGEDDASA